MRLDALAALKLGELNPKHEDKLEYLVKSFDLSEVTE